MISVSLYVHISYVSLPEYSLGILYLPTNFKVYLFAIISMVHLTTNLYLIELLCIGTRKEGEKDM